MATDTATAAKPFSSAPEVEDDLEILAAELRRLEGEYNMFFAGRRPRPPWETRGRVEAILKRWDRARIPQSGPRFRFGVLQARFSAFADLWDRGLRAKEEGRNGPLVVRSSEMTVERRGGAQRIVHVAMFTDPIKELDKLEALYEALMDTRRELGSEVVPFHRFADLVKTEVKKLQAAGSDAVAFRVSVTGKNLSLTARALRGSTVH
ncbi:MAG: hypothetical protein U0Q12_10650 [Vicinamibacterales bacterium]